MKYLTTILAILGLYLVVLGCSPKEIECTDDGCPEWNELVTPPIPDDLDIRGDLKTEYFVVPVVSTGSKDEFVHSLNRCIDYLYETLPSDQHIPRELVIAQAAIETGWGTSRFANEGNNLFGIRTFNKDEEWLLPITWDQNKWIGWGVKVYSSRCESVKDYVRILNEVYAYEDFRALRDQGADVYELADTLTSYATRPTYTTLIKDIIKYNIVGVYEL